MPALAVPPPPPRYRPKGDDEDDDNDNDDEADAGEGRSLASGSPRSSSLSSTWFNAAKRYLTSASAWIVRSTLRTLHCSSNEVGDEDEDDEDENGSSACDARPAASASSLFPL